MVAESPFLYACNVKLIHNSCNLLKSSRFCPNWELAVILKFAHLQAKEQFTGTRSYAAFLAEIYDQQRSMAMSVV
jgi:hypothetical protein